MFNSCLDIGLGNLLKMSLLEKGLDKMTSRNPFQLEPFCDYDFVILAAVCAGSQKGQLHPRAPRERSSGADTNLFSVVTDRTQQNGLRFNMCIIRKRFFTKEWLGTGMSSPQHWSLHQACIWTLLSEILFYFCVVLFRARI